MLYRSYIPVNAGEKTVISFDVDFTQSEQTVIGFGCGSERVTEPNEVTKMVYIDNCLALIGRSNDYELDGDYIYRKDGDKSKFFDYALIIEGDKVYEQIKSIANYNPDETEIKVSNGKVFHYVDGKYVIDGDKVKLNKNFIQLSAIYVFENDELKYEKFIFGDELSGFVGKLRYIISVDSTVIDVSKGKDNIYETIVTPMFSPENENEDEKDEYTYVYLTYEGIEPKNFLINFKEVV